MLKDAGREKPKPKHKQYIICPECKRKNYLTDDNTERIVNVTLCYCECGNEIEVK
jgi:hypothetical protein